MQRQVACKMLLLSAVDLSFAQMCNHLESLALVCHGIQLEANGLKLILALRSLA